jgi:cysteine synthase A
MMHDLIKKDTVLVEATSGNTGIALAAHGAAMGNSVEIIMPRNMSDERKQMMRVYGATIIEVGDSDFEGAIQLRNDMLKEWRKYWSPCQFENTGNIDCHYLTTAPEISRQLPKNEKWNAFISGAGTGGTLMGLHKYRKKMEENYSLVMVKPKEDAASHGIQGINDGADFLIDHNVLDATIDIATEDAKNCVRSLAKEYGLMVGISSGANVLAARRWIKEHQPEGAVVTILCDRGERYLSVL